MLLAKVSDFNTKNRVIAQGIAIVSNDTAMFGTSINGIDSANASERIGGANRSPIRASALDKVVDEEYLYLNREGYYVMIGNV